MINLASIYLIFNFGGGEIFIILLVFILLFGATRIPEVARAVGTGMRDIKNATGDIQREIKSSTNDVGKVTRDMEARIRHQAQNLEGSLNRSAKPSSPPSSVSEVPETDTKSEAPKED